MTEPPADDYDSLTVKEVKERVRSGLLDPATAHDYEVENKDRVTLTRWLDDRLETDTGPETVVVAPTRKRRVATFWIDEEDLYEPMTVDRTPKIEEAIEAGDLQVINR